MSEGCLLLPVTHIVVEIPNHERSFVSSTSPVNWARKIAYLVLASG